MNPELLYQIALTKVDGVGDSIAKNLISFCGSASAVFKEKKSFLTKVPGIGSITAENICRFKDFSTIESELEIIDKHKINAHFYMDKSYPTRLRHCDDSPLVLFAKGSADLNHTRIVSIVGTRKSTSYGRIFTDDLVNAFKEHNVFIISGLASGTDTNAHKASLKNGIPTIGVLGHGFGTMYPGSNKNLSEEMLKNGALLTEFTFNTPGSKENFPKRNRIVAGMCDTLIVVESGIKGGSLITADLANQYNRDVFALPGRINDTWSLGCNHLIYNHQAAIINDISDLIVTMGFNTPTQKVKKLQLDLLNGLSSDEMLIMNILQSGNTAIDDLHFKSGIAVNKLAFVLLNLEFRNVIRAHPGKVYSINNSY